MKDFVSRITFGFLMAQLFPGAVTVFAITFAYFSFKGELPDSVVQSANFILLKWQDAPLANALFLLGLFVAFGMLIHGIHWAILGTLEQIKEESKQPSMFDLPMDRSTIAYQFLIAPLRFFYELSLVAGRQGFLQAAVRENVSRIRDKWMKQHEFMQDFYLNTAQFFAHTSYALIFCQLALLAYMFRGHPCVCTVTYGFTGRRVFLLVMLYAGSSAFFILSRVQLATLFAAERELIAKSEAGGNGD